MPKCPKRDSYPVKLVARKKADQNTSLVDPWTAVHVGAGLAVGLMGIPLRWAFLGATAYEFLELPFEAAGFGKTLFNVSKPENIPNQIVDVVVFMGAAELGRRWNKT